MQAIQVKYLGPSNVRGARLKAKADAGSVTIGYPHELGAVEEAFRFAAEALVKKLGWDHPNYGLLVGGQLPDGSYAFVFTGRDNMYARRYGGESRENSGVRGLAENHPRRFMRRRA